MRNFLTAATKPPFRKPPDLFSRASHLGIARANPTTDSKLLDNTVSALEHLGVTHLITIGGDDTAFSAMRVEQHARGGIRVVHVPKTIDNDLDLPAHIDTFGFQTARHYGVEIVKNLMVDAKTTSRWYFVITMGRKGGHLALGIGKAAGATLTLIPEEFGGRTVRLKTIVDTLAGTILKRHANGRGDGVVVLAEGLAEVLLDRRVEIERATLNEAHDNGREGRLGERGGGHYGVSREREFLFGVAHAVGLEIDDLATMEERDASTGDMRGSPQAVHGRIDLCRCKVAPVRASDCGLLRRGRKQHTRESCDVRGSKQAGISLNAETLSCGKVQPADHILRRAKA